MPALPPLIHDKSRMRRRACTDPCGGRSAMVVPTATIKGYSREYLEASSPRRQQIEEYLAKENQRGAGAAQIAAHQTREEKLELSHEEMQERHRAMAEAFGHQP